MRSTCKTAASAALASLTLVACGGLLGGDPNLGSENPSGQESSPNPSDFGGFFGAPIVDTLASTLSADRSKATADGQDAITITAVLMTPTGAPGAGAKLDIDVSGTSNGLSQHSVLADTSGIVRVTLVSTKAETKTLKARVSGASLGALVLSFVAGPVSAERSRFVSSPQHPRANGEETARVTLLLRDRFDNAVAGAAVTLTVDGFSTEPSAPTSGVSDAAGEWSFMLSSDVAESKRLSAVVGALSLTGSLRFVDEWFNAMGAPYGARFRCVSVDSAQAGAVRIDVVTEAGAFASYDGGKHVGTESAGLPRNEGCAALLLDGAAPSPVLYAALQDGRTFFKRRSDALWSALSTPPAGGTTAAWLDTRDGSELWIGRDSAPYTMRWNGSAWTDTGSGLAAAPRAFAQSGSSLFVATDTDVFEKNGNGAWTATGGPSGTRALAMLSGTLFAATSTGLWRRALGAWSEDNDGWPSETCASSPCKPALSAIAAGNGVLYAASEVAARRKVFSRAFGASSFVALTRQTEAADERISVLVASGGTVYIGQDTRGLFAAGPLETARIGKALRFAPLRDLALDPARAPARLFVADRFGLSFSDDQGDSWQRAMLGVDEEALALAVDTSVEPSRVWVATQRQGPSVVLGLWQSNDGGDSFFEVSDALGTLAAQPPVSLAALETSFVTDGYDLFSGAPLAKLALPSPPMPSTYAIRSLTAVSGSLAIATSSGAFLRTKGTVTRLGGESFTQDVRRLLRTPLGAYWFATVSGVYSAATSSTTATLVGGGAFNDLALDDRGDILWAAAEAGGPASSSLYRFVAGGGAAPVSSGIPLGVDALRVALLPASLGGSDRRVVFVALAGGVGIYASSY